MNSDWQELKISHIAKINPESLKKSNNLKVIEYIDTSSVTKNSFSRPEILDITNAPSRAKRIVRDNDILVSTVRPNLEHHGFIKKANGSLIVSTGFAVIRCYHEVIPKFIYYLISQKQITDYLASIADTSTTTYPSIKPSVIANLDIKVPDIQSQKKIAHILTTLDDKIELNKKINQTLEFIAQAMFKSWFVDFDPVHAKANAKSVDEYDAIAKELGISREILDLFPSEFEESELKLIPKGWSVQKLGSSELEIESGRRPKGGIDKSLKSGVPSIGAESIQSPIGTFDYANVKYVSQNFSMTTRRGWGKNFDVMLYKDGGKPGLFKPRISLYGENFPFKEFMINEHVFILRSHTLGQFYLYYLISSDLILEQLIAKGSSKAAQPGLNQDEVKGSHFVLPPVKLTSTYNKIVKNLVTLQLNNGKENNWLSTVRETLLPRLLSGEIDVSSLNLGPEND